MSDEQQLNELLTVCAERSVTCERGILAKRNDGNAGFALVAPDCILFAQIVLPGITGELEIEPLVFEQYLN